MTGRKNTWRRNTLVVMGGVVVWAVLFGGARVLVWLVMPAAFDHEGFTVDPVALCLLLVASVACSLGVGRMTARLARENTKRWVWVLALLQLGIGIVVQASTWSRTPAWWHLAFLILLVPGHILGARRVAPAVAEA